MTTWKLELLGQEATHAWAAYGSIFLTATASQLTIPMLEQFDDAGRAVWARDPSRYCTLALTPTGVRMPDAATRARTSEVMKSSGPRIFASALVLEGTGFWAGTARSVVASMSFLSGSSYDQKVFAEVAPASSWLGQQAGLTAAALEDFRQAALAFRTRTLPPVPA